MKKHALAIGATAISLAFTIPALAQGMGQGPVAAACAQEIEKYCSGIPHGRGAVRACLEENTRKLSEQCRAALGGTGGGRRTW
jgi:hypothetical protein